MRLQIFHVLFIIFVFVQVGTSAMGIDIQQIRIIGGTDVALGEFKSQVSLQGHFKSHICGGTLIDDRHVLTAAHCYQNQKIIVYVMGDDLLVSYKGSETRQLRIIKHFVRHPNYNRTNLHNDVAVIRLDAPFRLSKNFVPAPRSKQSPKVDDECHVVGWGYTTTDENAQISKHLLKARVQVRDINFCNSSDSYEGLMQKEMFCAGDKEGLRDSCQGDSGGYMTCDGQTLTGVVSFGYECGLANFPGVYSDVSHYNEWIDEIISSETLPEYEFALESTTPAPHKPPINETRDSDTENISSSANKLVKDSPQLFTILLILIYILIRP